MTKIMILNTGQDEAFGQVPTADGTGGYTWQDQVAGGTSRVFVGPNAPTVSSGEYVWFQTDGNGNLVDIISGKVTP